jgi:micrococcal nuclease
MKRFILLGIILIGALLSWLQNNPSDQVPSPPSSLQEYPVLHIIDGDTIVIKTTTGEDKVRFIGIDAPETNVTNGAVECYGLEATEYLRYELEKETVTLEIDPSQGERDTYGRLLAYVFLNGTNINQALVLGGYAREFTYDEPYKYRKEFKEAEVQAKEAQKGIWAPSCNS